MTVTFDHLLHVDVVESLAMLFMPMRRFAPS